MKFIALVLLGMIAALNTPTKALTVSGYALPRTSCLPLCPLRRLPRLIAYPCGQYRGITAPICKPIVPLACYQTHINPNLSAATQPKRALFTQRNTTADTLSNTLINDYTCYQETFEALKSMMQSYTTTETRPLNNTTAGITMLSNNTVSFKKASQDAEAYISQNAIILLHMNAILTKYIERTLLRARALEQINATHPTLLTISTILRNMLKSINTPLYLFLMTRASEHAAHRFFPTLQQPFSQEDFKKTIAKTEAFLLPYQ